jgi:large subunit ribosomal protein L29
MKAKEIHELTDEDLKSQLAENRAELFNLRFQMATSQLDNTARINMVKKDVARVLTVIREREISAELESILDEQNAVIAETA